MKIYTDVNALKKTVRLDVDFVSSEFDADIILKRIFLKDYYNNDHRNNVIYYLDKIWTRSPLRRTGNCVDDDCMDFNFSETKKLFFTNNDCCSSNLINLPVGFIPCEFISKKPNYWERESRCIDFSFKNKVYWSGTLSNHQYRQKIFNFYKNINDSRFSINSFEEPVYGPKPLASNVYKKFINNLSESDICFCIRGDLPSTYSFFDILRRGCVPILINCYYNTGWENILKTDDYFLSFNLETESLDNIHVKVLNLLQDRDRLLKMKKNCVSLYESYFKHNRHHALPYADFVIAKCIELYENNFQLDGINNQLITKRFLTLVDHD